MSRSRSSSMTIELLSFIFLPFPSLSMAHFLIRSLKPFTMTVNMDLAVLHSSSRMHSDVIARGRRPMVSDIPVATSERRAFWMYWTSTTISYLGDGIRFVALPLLAATLTSSPAQVASVAVAAGLPWPLFGLLAGVVADRWDRNRLLFGSQAMRAALGFLLAFGVVTGHV